MSYITDVVVHIDYLTSKVEGVLEGQFYAGVYPSGNARIERLSRISTSDAGGGKVFTGAIYVGSYNHLDTDAFLSWFAYLPWNDYSHAVLSMATECEVYKVYCVEEGKVKLLNIWYT